MRILLTADTVGGVWDYACTLARALDADGHHVLLAVIGDLGDRQSNLPQGVEVASRLYRLEWMPGAGEDVEACNRWIGELARLWQADVVHLNQFACALERFHVPTLVVGHSDVLSWFSETTGAAAPPDWDGYAGRVRRALRLATAVVTPTKYQSRLLDRHCGRGADRVIHNGAAPPATVDQVRRRLVVCAARAWDAAKGAKVLDDAVGMLGEYAPPVHLLGELTSPEGERLRPRNLVTHGAVQRAEVDRWLGSASIYVSPSLYEPFGLAPLESALHGCALVLSDIGAFRELWEGCAEFFPSGDAPALAARLEPLAGDPQRVARLAAAARKRALRRYTADRMCRDYLSLYADLVVGRRPLARPVRQPA